MYYGYKLTRGRLFLVGVLLGMILMPILSNFLFMLLGAFFFGTFPFNTLHGTIIVLSYLLIYVGVRGQIFWRITAGDNPPYDRFDIFMCFILALPIVGESLWFGFKLWRKE